MDKAIINRLLPDNLPLVADIEAKYPQRNLKDGVKVTRIAPSPTGFMHIGGLYAALISERLAHQSGGTFYLRIEDTDTKREVEGAAALIESSLSYYDINFDEGPIGKEGSIGSYGPYVQSQREDIYKAYIKDMLETDRAYPCFCTEEELDEIRRKQELNGVVRPGYYGQWAKWRDMPEEKVLQALDSNVPFVIRFKSPGSPDGKVIVHDILKGNIEFPESDMDIVIMKSDGLPTYHFAHIIDDHLMGTTHVVRGDEWVSSMPLHIQLFKAMGWKTPKYGHIAPIQKNDDGGKRKLSKRKDPEASVAYYDEKGYPKNAVIEYLLNLANSNFEDWRRVNLEASYKDFQFSLNKLNNSGALFDFVKLNNISKNVISLMSADEVYETGLEWAEKHNEDLASLMKNNPDYVKNILSIERGQGAKNRKDIATWEDLAGEIEYFFDDKFDMSYDILCEKVAPVSGDDIKKILNDFMSSYDTSADKNEWFDKVKAVADNNGFASDMKAYKANKEAFKGSVADVAKIIRLAVTGRDQSPDLHAIMIVMGKDRVFSRINNIISA